MPFYRKRPVIVQAEVYREGLEDGFEVFDDWNQNPLNAPYFKWKEDCKVKSRGSTYRPAIKTLEGWHVISPGDYIITGVAGERYPCKPEIFLATYELVGE